MNALAVPAGKMVLAIGDCSVTVSCSVTIDASSSDCSDGAAEIDSAAVSSTDMLAQLLRGISGYSYEAGTLLSVSGSGSQVILTRATAQTGTGDIVVTATNEDLSGNSDFSWSNNASAEATAQTDSIVLPRNLVAGDALSLTLDGATYVQNVTGTPATDFTNFVSNLDGLSNFAVTGDYSTRTITVTSTVPGTSFAALQGGLSHSAASTTVTSAVAAVAQKDSFTLPHLPVAGETVSAVVDSVSYSQAFVTDGTTTLQNLASAITAGGTVTASLTGTTTVELLATVAGVPFTVGNIEITGTTAPVQVTANGTAVAQKDSITVPFAPAAGDTFSVTVGTGTVSQAFVTDSDTTLSLLNTAIEGLGTVSSALDPATRTFTLESKTPGTGFSASLSASGASISSSGVIANEPNVMQIDSLTITRTFGAGDSLIVTVDGTGTVIPFATDTATTVANLAAWIDSLPSVSASVSGSEGNFAIAISAAVPGTPFVGATLTVDSTVSAVNVQPNVPAVAQVDSITVPRDLVAGDVLSVSLSGSTIVSATFSGSESATIAELAAGLDALSGVSAASTGKVITVTAEVAGVPFELLPLSLTGNVPSTVTQNNVVPVAQVDTLDLPATVSGDVLTVTLDGASVTANYAGSDSATAAALATALSASGTVNASASGSTVTVTASVPGTPFTLGSLAVSNVKSATVNTVYVPAVAQVVDFDAASVTEGWTYTATLNGKDYSVLTNSGDTDASVESAIASMIASDTGSVIVSTGTTSFTLTASVPGVAFTFAASALDLTAPIVSTPTSAAEILKSGDTSTSTVSSNEDGVIYAVASGTVVTTPSDITSAIAAHDAFIVTNSVKDAVYTVTVPVGVNDGAYDFVAVDPSGNVSGRMLGWLTVDNTAPLLVIGTPSGQSVHAVAMTVTGTTDANAVVTVTGSSTASANADASGNFSVSLPLTHDSLNSFTFSVTDAAGNVTTRTFDVTEDGVGPAIAVSASGTVYESGATFAFIGQTEPNLAVAVTELSSGTVVSLVSDASGSFAVPALPLTLDSVNQFTVTATDAAGNTGSVSFTVVQDNQNPVVVLDPLPTVIDANQIAVSGTTDSNIAVSVTDGTVTLTGVSDGTGTFSVVMPLTQNATNAFTVTATDLASRTGTASVSTVEDSVANTLVIGTQPATVNAAAIALTGSTKPNSDLTVTGGAATLTGTADIAGNWGFLVALNANSANVLDVASVDALGNTATGSVTIVEDSIAPVVTLATVDHTTYATTVPVSGTTEAFAVVTVTGGSGSVTTVADASGSFVASVDLVPASANALTVTATDAAGNAGLATVTITQDPVVVYLNLDQSGSYVTNAANFLLTGTAKPNASFQVTGGTSTLTGTVDGSGAFSATVALNANAINVLDVTVTDATSSTATGSVTVTHDDIAPTISFGSVPSLTNAVSVTVTGSTDSMASLTATDLSGTTFTGSADAFGDFSMTLPLILNS
ncbi:MAG: Ig-like domain-containing protein, partial [Patescibacteria group bacterium]